MMSESVLFMEDKLFYNQIYMKTKPAYFFIETHF